MRAEGVRGANVTVPHKEAVIALIDHTDPQAARVGAVNTIVNDNGALHGHNTDVLGFWTALRALVPTGAHNLSCLVLGAGGAARAVVASLLLDGPREIWVANRTFERAVALCASMADRRICGPLSFADAYDLAAAVDLVVNATSLGLLDSVKEFPLAVDTLHSGQVLVDIVYGSVPTPLVLAARARGVLAIDGKEMLIQQAARSYQLWTGREAPLDIMRESITVLEG
jgi:shikimate dehydrogenase